MDVRSISSAAPSQLSDDLIHPEWLRTVARRYEQGADGE